MAVSELGQLGAGIAIGFGAIGAGLGIGFATKVYSNQLLVSQKSQVRQWAFS